MKRISKTLISTLAAAGIIGASLSAYAATTGSTSTTTNSAPSTAWGRGDHHRGGWGGPGGLGNMMTTLAKDLNISTATLQSDLKAGKTIASIAQAQGVSTTTLISDLESAAKTNLDQAVSSGKLSSTQEQQMITNMNQRITDFVNGTMPPRPANGPGGWGGRGTCTSSTASASSASASD